MTDLFIIVVDDVDKAKKLLKKFSRNGYGVVRVVAIAVELNDSRVLGGFVSQYNARVVKSLIISPNLT